MRNFKFIYLFFLIIATVSCKKEDIRTPDGDYAVNFDFREGDITAPAKVILTNRSKYADRYEWKFENAKALLKDGSIVDVTSSTKVVPDTLFYELPGEYNITLTAWQGSKSETITKKIKVIKMKPKIIVPENIGIYLDVEFSAQAFQYPGEGITYLWDFGEAGTSTEAKPKVQFVTEGKHTVNLTVNDGQEELTSTVEIDVLGELAKTIYFTDAVTRKIYKLKLTSQTESQVESIGVTTGYNPLGLTVAGAKLYLSETGLGTRFSSGDAALADGKLISYNLDGSGENLITKSAAPQDYRDDPWMNTVDKFGNIWWTCRNWGVRVLNSSASEVPYPAIKFNITAAQAGEGISTYFSSDIKEVGNEMWVSYTGTTGKGIYKFSAAGTYIGKFSTAIQGFAIRSFAVDTVNSHIYFAINIANGSYPVGIYRSDIDGANITTVANGADMVIGTYSNQGAANEYIYITDMELDVDEAGNGFLYYGYRHNNDVNGSGNPPTTVAGAASIRSSVRRVNVKDNVSEDFIKGYAPYGIAIDHVRR